MRVRICVFCLLWSPVPGTDSSLQHVAGKCWMNREVNLTPASLSILMSHLTSSSPIYSYLSNLPAFSLNTPYFPTSSVPFFLLLPLLTWLILTCSSLQTWLRGHLCQKAFLGPPLVDNTLSQHSTNYIACCLPFCLAFPLNHTTSLKVLFGSVFSVLRIDMS